MQELTHYINGAHVKGTSGRFRRCFNPATGEVQAKVPLANGARWTRPCNRQRRQAGWAATNPQRRARVMMALSAC